MIAVQIGTDVQTVARRLIDALGSKMTAEIGGARYHWSAQRWAKGLRVPDSVARCRLKLALEITDIVSVLGPHVPWAFMISAHPGLGDYAPIVILREASYSEAVDRLLPAARRLVEES